MICRRFGPDVSQLLRIILNTPNDDDDTVDEVVVYPPDSDKPCTPGLEIIKIKFSRKLLTVENDQYSILLDQTLSNSGSLAIRQFSHALNLILLRFMRDNCWSGD